ncbi:MAG: helix-hairpin-helix domain-containing protein [Deltaproteobacteria bacterium]|nr:helix-hairpin-helix domain-containing protein [Deltaproteobacteria bacterium]
MLSFLMLALAGSAMAAPPSPGKDINKATAEEFTTVKGIGEKTASKIIAERAANGPFKSLEDMQERVKGVGEKTIERFRAAGWTAITGPVKTPPARPDPAPEKAKTGK